MTVWPRHPVIYEINTWVWLQEMGRNKKDPVTLDTVPKKEWDALAALGVDAVWLMGVWERSPAGIAIANQNKELLEDFRCALPDFRPEDNVGSPYCVRQYVVDKFLGGPEGLTVARRELAGRGLKLILDFVPNHVAPDHPWVSRHPEYFVQGTRDDLKNDPASFIERGGKVFARGKDPFSPAWPDVLQLNVFQPGLREAAIETLLGIAGQSDGVRCDMAMLVMNPIFKNTWGDRVGHEPPTEYWQDIIQAVKETHPEFLFMAEAYWNLERDLQEQGFDYCYDKRLYERLEHGTAESVRRHLRADPACQEKLVRFIENHDEPRARSVFSPQKERAAAVTIATVPGARLFHEGQFEGRKIRHPVFLGRRPVEPADPELQAFYYTLLMVDSFEGIRNGRWRLCEQTGRPDNASYHNLISWCWSGAGERHLIIVNFSESSAQGLIRLPWDDLKGKRWQVTDFFTGQMYELSGNEMCDPGFPVDLPPWGFHVLTRWRPESSFSRNTLPS